MSNKSVIKHSATVQVTNRINLLQRRAWNVLLANAYDELPKKEKYEVKVKDLMEVLGLSKSNNDQHIKDTCKDLIKCVVEWNVLGKDGENEWGASGLLAEATIKDGILTYAYGPTLRERLYNPAMYARINLSMQNRFNSKHALAIYELCVDYFISRRGAGETPWIRIEDFRKLMGVDEKDYPEFKKLNQRAIKDPIKEINEKSDLSVEVEYEKHKRKIIALKFRIKPHPKRRNPLEQLEELPAVKELVKPKEADRENEIFKQLEEFFCLTPSQCQEILSSHDFDYIQGNLERVEKDYKAGKVKDIAAYTLKALKDDFRPKKSAFELEKEQTAQAEKNKTQERERIEKLQQEYDAEITSQAEILLSSLSAEAHAGHVKDFEEQVIAKNKGFMKVYKDFGIKSNILKGQFHCFLVRKLGPEAFQNLITYAESKGIVLKTTRGGDYRIEAGI